MSTILRRGGWLFGGWNISVAFVEALKTSPVVKYFVEEAQEISQFLARAFRWARTFVGERVSAKTGFSSILDLVLKYQIAHGSCSFIMYGTSVLHINTNFLNILLSRMLLWHILVLCVCKPIRHAWDRIYCWMQYNALMSYTFLHGHKPSISSFFILCSFWCLKILRFRDNLWHWDTNQLWLSLIAMRTTIKIEISWNRL